MSSYTVGAIAKLLTNARKDRGLTQQQLARLLGLPQSYVARIEAGKTDLRTSKLMEIARLLDLEVFFIRRDQVPTVQWALAGNQEIDRRQLSRSLYEPDEETNDQDQF